MPTTFTSVQLDTLAQAFSASTEDNVATKLDMAGLKTEIAEIKVEIANLRTELRTDIAAVRSDLAAVKVEIVRWIVGAIAFNLLGTIGLMIAIAQLVLKGK